MKRIIIIPALLLILLLVFWRCARQTQPTGGPKDTIAPVLIWSKPVNGQRNFKGTDLEFRFNEAIKLKDPKEEILIMPSAGAKTKFVAKNYSLTIIPEKKWKDSTTYSISFREAVQDLNEGNPSENLHLAFSTGAVIDSLSIYGSLSEVFKDKAPEKITVGLYESDTFDIFNHSPIYFTKTNKAGVFVISNLKPGDYHIYAFDDKNKNLKVDSKTERFGFLADTINLPGNKDSLRIQIIQCDARPLKLTSVRNSSSTSKIRFNKALSKIKLSTDTSIIYTYGDTRSEIVVYKDFNKKDSLKINVFAMDSIEHKIDTAVYVKYTNENMIPEKFKIGAWQVNYNYDTDTVTAKTTMNKLLSSVNYDSIYVQIDTSTFQTIKPAELKIDTLNQSINLKFLLQKSNQKNAANPTLFFGKGAFISVDQDSTKEQDIKIKILKPDEMGSLSVKIETKEPHYKIELRTSDHKVVATFKDEKEHTFTNLSPGEYGITIHIDRNNNDKWDPGDFHKHTEPEIVFPHKSLEKKFTFPIRANWEVGPLLIKL